ncbi:MAG TPA: alpha/beta hydrolase [bacterium]|nr:alpha/beta hydrolase [bacterium]
MTLRTVDFCLEGPREIWGTLTLPEGDPAKPPVVMSHGFLGFKDWSFFPWVAGSLAAAGYPVVRFNFSGSGMGPQADGPFEDLAAFEADTITRQVEDLKRVLGAVVSGGFEPDLPAVPRAFLWGHSRGGGVSLLAAVNRPEVLGIATWATLSRVNRYLYEMKKTWKEKGYYPFESSRTGQVLKSGIAFLEDAEHWGREGDIPTYLHHLTAPVLLVHGSEDVSVKPDESESLAALHPSAQLAILAGADHKFNSVHPFPGPSPALEAAFQRTLAFFESVRGGRP